MFLLDLNYQMGYSVRRNMPLGYNDCLCITVVGQNFRLKAVDS